MLVFLEAYPLHQKKFLLQNVTNNRASHSRLKDLFFLKRLYILVSFEL